MAGSNLENMINALRGNFGTMSPAEDAEIPLNPFEEAHKNLFGGVVEAPYHAAKAIGGMMDAARQAPPAGLRREDYSEDPSAPQPSQGLSDATVRATAALIGGGIPAAEPGAAGIFTGRLGNARLPASTGVNRRLELAQAMQADGLNKLDVLGHTGWMHHPADNAWKREISDQSMRMTLPFGKPFGSDPKALAIGPVGAFVDHKDLFKMYPAFRDQEMVLGFAEQPSGWYMPKQGGGFKVQVSAPDVETARSIAAHELQHAVAHHEGWEYGADPSAFAKVMENELRSRDSLNAKEIQNAAAVANAAYRGNIGEVEARNTQARLPLSQEVRNRYIPPWETQDIPYEQQVKRGQMTPETLIKALRSMGQ